ncbi:dicarboxylate/amino acid:cation symporter [Fusobacterium perfoetens]|uniref:dicarboxylate/amino acid:cation symporter n=1 Tax=Fusobacterium perfoetens TaxID=852 RepID=UPI001F19D228|nr:dicarboxylate/amino acid:cation symporter [Fusobacterium perfoetens]MCF2612131.1 dicarboxylate/amino acid:cation symporter [Fusobacterium perfoetens]
MKKFGLLPKLILGILAGIAIGKMKVLFVVELLATFNNIFGSFLGFIIPLIIVGFVAPGIGNLGKSAGKLLGGSTVLAYVSTIIAGSFAYVVDTNIFPKLLNVGSFILHDTTNPEEALVKSLINIKIAPLMDVMTALVLAFVLGLGIAYLKEDTVKKFMDEFQLIVEGTIKSVIIPLLPFHISGIFANMTYAGKVEMIIAVFAKVFVVIITLHILILLFQYTVAGSLNGKNPISLIRNMLPAYFTAVGTQSSAATIPVTLAQTKKNGANDGIAEFTVPLFATIHLSGSTITLTSCSLAIMMLEGMNFSFGSYFGFILMLGVTMVAAPGVPGGAVMAALGLIQSMLGFNAELSSLMIALYLAQDSFGTACNVTGDGALALIVNKFAGFSLDKANK